MVQAPRVLCEHHVGWPSTPHRRPRAGVGQLARDLHLVG